MTTLALHSMTEIHWLSRLSGLLATARRRARERRDLALVEDRDLRELGISRSEIAYELNKPFWRD